MHIALSRSEIDEPSRTALDARLSRAMVDIEAAEALEIEGRYREALGLLDRSVEQLSAILRLMGVDI